jgi:serine phosphatase RsbU (regulator of sigma subunit)
VSVTNPGEVGGLAARADDAVLETVEWVGDLSTAVTMAETVGKALETGLEPLVRRLGLSRGVALIAGKRGDLSVIASCGDVDRTALDRRFTLVDPGSPRAVYDADEVHEPFLDRAKPLLEALPCRLVMPLARAGRLYGIYLLGRPNDSPPTPEALGIARLLSGIVAYVLEARAVQGELRRANTQLGVKTYQLQTLVEIGRELNLAPDVDVLYGILCGAVVGHTGTPNSVVLERGEESFRLAYAHHVVPTADEIDQLASPAFFHHVATLARPVTTDELEGLPGYVVLLRWGITHFLPMRHRERVRGLLGVGGRGGESPTAADFDFLTALATQASVTRENLRLRDEALVRQRLEKELSIARRIQRSLLPDRSPTCEGYEIATRMRTSFEVGGDYYDFIEAGPGLVGLAVGDVPGKGTPAALFMATVQATVRALAAELGPQPAELLRQVNRLVTRATKGENFVTFLYGLLDTRQHRFLLANAGHCYPAIVRKGGTVTILEKSDLVFGFVEDVSYGEIEIELEPGDLLVVYTDGLSEAQNPAGELFGEGHLEAALGAQRGATAHDVVTVLFDALDRFVGTSPAQDDTTVVAVRRLPCGAWDVWGGAIHRWRDAMVPLLTRPSPLVPP